MDGFPMCFPIEPDPPARPVDDNAVYAAFGTWIRTRRKHYRLTQADLASLIGLTRTSVTNIERGRQRVLLHDFIRIHRILTNAVQQAPRMTAFTKSLLKRPDDAIAFLREIGALDTKGGDNGST